MASNPVPTGRRASARLRLSLPGVFLAIRGNLRCIVTNMSQTGVLIAVDEALNVGDEGYLRCGPIDHFVTVTRKDGGLNALVFDRPVSKDFMLQIREFQDTLAQRDQAELMETVRSWTQGDNRGHW